MRASLLVVALLPASLALTQTVAPLQSSYDPLKTFAPLTLPDPVNAYRSSDGAPGPQYWQNRADYELHATITPPTKTLTGMALITYTNNSPDTLTSLWLNLEQNIYRKDSRATAFSGGSRPRPSTTGVLTNTDGYQLDSVEVQFGAREKPTKAVTVISDTRLQIRLPETAPLLHGGKVRILIHYHYTIPGTLADALHGPSTSRETSMT